MEEYWPWKSYCPCANCPRARKNPFQALSWDELYDQLVTHAAADECVGNHDEFWDPKMKPRLLANSWTLAVLDDADDVDEAAPAHAMTPPPDPTAPPRPKRRWKALEAVHPRVDIVPPGNTAIGAVHVGGATSSAGPSGREPRCKQTRRESAMQLLDTLERVEHDVIDVIRDATAKLRRFI